MAEFVNTKGGNTTAASGGEKSGSKGKVSKGMNSSELINSIEDAQVDELYEMDDWGKILTLLLYFHMIDVLMAVLILYQGVRGRSVKNQG